MHDSENENQGHEASNDDNLFDDIELNASAPQQRRTTSKKKWITPRLCAALDEAKVKKMRSEK